MGGYSCLAWLLAFALMIVPPLYGKDSTPARDVHAGCLDPLTGHHGSFSFEKDSDFGDYYVAHNQIKNAIPCFEAAHALNLTGFQTVFNLTLAYLKTDQLQAAHSLVEKQMTMQDSARLHNLFGMVESKQGDFRGAADQYQVAAQAEQSEQNLSDLGSSLLKFQGDSAEKVFRYGVAKYPKSVRLHVGLGLALYAQGEDTRAIEEICRGAALDPSDPQPMEIIGKMEEIPPSMATEIIDRFAGLVRLYPRNGLLLYDYAMALSGRTQSRNDAVSPQLVGLLKRSIALDPHLDKAYFQLGKIEEQQRHFTKAVQYYQTAVRLDPDNGQYLYRLAFTYKNSGNAGMFAKEMKRFRVVNEKTAQTQ